MKSKEYAKILFGLGLAIMLLAGHAAAQVRSVILMIGDGMGPKQVEAASILIHDKPGRLAMQQFPVKGSLTTKSANAEVTDSAAAGTALATGHKTNNGMISVSPDGKALKTILEACRDAGKATGLIATSTITHATPASFAAHVPNRGEEAEIAVQMLETRPNLMFGGGLGLFLSRAVKGSARKDERDLLAEAREAGYSVVNDEEEMAGASGEYVLGLFGLSSLETGKVGPQIGAMTAKALELLGSAENGFFLMVEGSQIDWGCHGNEQDYYLREIKAFDAAVKTAFEFAEAAGDVLVVVTADHETGGMAARGKRRRSLSIHWGGGGHTSTDVPLFAYGPGSKPFAGPHDNTEVPKLIAQAIGLVNF